MSSTPRRLLCLTGPALVSPWAELGTLPPNGTSFDTCNLIKANEWIASATSETTPIVLVDIDVIAQTIPFDDWAATAWKNTLNEIVLKAIDPNTGRAPLLLGYTREPNWDRALVALKVGVRDLVKLSRLQERLHQLLDGTSPALETAPETESSNVVAFKKTPSLDAPVMPGMRVEHTAVPKHAIPFPIDGLEGTSAAIEGVRNLVRKSAPLDTSVLIAGATGTGKERVARALHRHSSRATGPFVAVNCGAIAPGLIESELFGHTKGAFTGAIEERMGWLASANGGTLFLDEVSELPLDVQVKLLRAVQEKQVTPVGATKAVSIDVRLVSATQHDLEERVASGKFREDLLYRLKVMEIQLPALRERRADIPTIAKTILLKCAKQAKHPVLEVSEGVVEKFLLYAWPGNVRELENALEHAATLAWSENRKRVEVRDLPENVQFAEMSSGQEHHLKEAVRNFERAYIQATVRRLGSKEQAADTLGLSLATLYRKLG